MRKSRLVSSYVGSQFSKNTYPHPLPCVFIFLKRRDPWVRAEQAEAIKKKRGGVPNDKRTNLSLPFV
jgi:hypothetical protein